MSDHLWALNGCAFLAMALGDRAQAEQFSRETFSLAGDTAFDALPNAYVFAAMNALFDADSEALAMAERALEVVPRTPSGAAHIPAAHHCRSLVLAHHRRWDAALEAAEVVLRTAEPGSPYRGEAQALRLAALSGLERTDLVAAALLEIVRPAPIRAQEWGLRLFDMIERGGADRGDLGRLAADALAMAGGDPVQRCRDLLASLLWVESVAVKGLARSDNVSAALSTSCFGALAAVAVGRARGWTDEAWFDERARLGRSEGYAQRKATALRTVADLSDLSRESVRQ